MCSKRIGGSAFSAEVGRTAARWNSPERGRLRDKLPQLEETLRGVMSVTQRWLLRKQLRKVKELDAAVARQDAKVAELCLPFA